MSERAAFCRSVWPDMVSLYRRPGVGEACLALQAEFDADVPLVLTFVLADRAGQGLDAAAFDAVTAAASAWRGLAVLPLRRLRQALKASVAGPAEEAFRATVKAAELEAERLEVERILALFEPAPGPLDGLAARLLDRLGVPAERSGAVLALFGAAATGPSTHPRAT